MDNDRWEQLVLNLKRKFKVLDEQNEDLLVDVGEEKSKQGEQNVLVVLTPLGKMRLVREIRPLVLEKKLHYSHQQGKSANFEYKFSDTEKTYKLRVYKWNDEEDEWIEIKSDSVAGMM